MAEPPDRDDPRDAGGEDAFGDLGPRPMTAAEKLAAGDEAELAAERKLDLQKQGPPRPSSAYSWVIGIVFLMAVAVAGANALRTGAGTLGPVAGHELPVFAAPTATGPIDADANVKTKKGQPGKTFACDVDEPGAVNICDLRTKPLVITFMFTRFADCAPQLDRVERMHGAFPGVNFLGVIVREPKKKAAALVRRHRWSFPVVIDRDGQVSNIYGIGGCPTTVFAAKGGRVRTTKLGRLTDGQLRAQVRRIAR